VNQKLSDWASIAEIISGGAVVAIADQNSGHLVLEEKVGPVQIRIDNSQRPLIWLRTPPINEGTTFDRDACAQALGLDRSDLLPITPQLLSAGNPTLFVGLTNKDAKWDVEASCTSTYLESGVWKESTLVATSRLSLMRR